MLVNFQRLIILCHNEFYASVPSDVYLVGYVCVRVHKSQSAFENHQHTVLEYEICVNRHTNIQFRTSTNGTARVPLQIRPCILFVFYVPWHLFWEHSIALMSASDWLDVSFPIFERVYFSLLHLCLTPLALEDIGVLVARNYTNEI